jgi:hypothetical protein
MLATLVMEISAYHASFFPKPQIPLEPVLLQQEAILIATQQSKGDPFFYELELTE